MQRREGTDKHYQQGGRDTHLVFGLETCNIVIVLLLLLLDRYLYAGPCARCEMVTLDQSTGARGGVEPLRTLAAYRRQKGRIFFGALLNCRAGLPSSDHRLRVSDLVLPT